MKGKLTENESMQTSQQTRKAAETRKMENSHILHIKLNVVHTHPLTSPLSTCTCTLNLCNAYFSIFILFILNITLMLMNFKFKA